MLKGKKILVGVTAGIAAYKAAFLIRLFIKAGAQVKVIMTPASKEFITPLTLSTLSKNPVYSDFSNTTTGEWANHVELGLWADLFIVAPTSANTIAKMANGICDNLLLATYLSAKCPVFIAPAMDLDMYKHASIKKNLKALESFGNNVITPGDGELASGLHGKGRMAEPQEIFDFISNSLKKKLPLVGKKVLVTAGPTYENIDPVRFIGNYSSGKMGFAIAEEFANNGAEVVLISGPTNLQIENSSIKRVDVISAEDMYNACVKYFNTSDYVIMSAAVADFTPKNTSNKKIKKTSDSLTIELLPTKDVLSEMGKQKTKKQILVGFALETNNELENAKNKLKRKNLDFIVLNSLNDKGAGFKGDTNKITIITRNNKTHKFELKSKAEVAKDIIKTIVS